MIYEKKIDLHAKRKLKLAENYMKAYSVVEGKCTKAMKYKLNSHPNNMQRKCFY